MLKPQPTSHITSYPLARRDRGTCILFGDGCGAVLLQATQGDCSLLSFDMNSDGLGNRHLTAAYCTSGVAKPTGSAPSDRSSYANIAMNGQEVFKFAVRNVPVSLQRSLDEAGLDAAAINFLVMHQARRAAACARLWPCASAAPGEVRSPTLAGKPAHFGCCWHEVRHRARTDRLKYREVRQHQRCFNPPGAGRGCAGRENQERRPSGDCWLWSGAVLGLGPHKVGLIHSLSACRLPGSSAIDGVR